MRFLRMLAVGLLVGLVASGCSGGLTRAKGRVIKGGEPYHPPEGGSLLIDFAPVDSLDSSHSDSYAAQYDPTDGTFKVVGKDGKGLPPGKYRVGIQLMKKKEDLLGGQLTTSKSPLLFDVAGDDIVIDLDKADFDSILKAPRKANKARRPRRT
jgi:hypothetical protein